MAQYIDGQWREGEGAIFRSIDPSTGDVVWEGREATEAEIGLAILAAKKAFKTWGSLSVDKRIPVLQRFKTLLEQRKDVLSLLISRETGKIGWDAQSEVAATIGKLAFSLEAYQERTGTRANSSKTGALQVSSLRHAPHGLLCVYGPYNFPAHLPNGHIMPALLAGNAVLFKPSELTPGVAEWMVRLWEEAGLPAGVLQLLQGQVETGKLLLKQDINGVLFTGSSATGRHIHAQFAGRPEVMLALEMGGNNPLIVYQPESIKAAVRETILSSFISSGQRCTCARRLIVVGKEGDKEADAYIEALVHATRALKIGSYQDTPEPFMGPVVNKKESLRVLEMQGVLADRGGKILVEAKPLHATLPYLSPSIIDVTGVSHLDDSEIFGPMLQLQRVDSVDNAITVANNTQFGLSAGVLSRHREVFDKLLQNGRSGLVNWNRQTTGASGAAPFGGTGLSGNHRPAGYYAADYCAYPVASIENAHLMLPDVLEPGLEL